MTISSSPPPADLLNNRHENSRPFLEHLHALESEAYHILENIDSPYKILKNFHPSSEQRKKATHFFSKIYYYLVGMHEDTRHNITDHQNKLIATSHNLVDLCDQLKIHQHLIDEFDHQLSKVTESQTKVLEHVKNINAMQCLLKIAFTLTSSALLIALSGKIYYDSSYCSMTSVVEDTQKSYDAMCPAPWNTGYYFSLVSKFVIAPYLVVGQIANRIKDHNFLNIFFENPAEDSLDACKRLSLGALMRISHIKNRILTLIQATPPQNS